MKEDVDNKWYLVRYSGCDMAESEWKTKAELVHCEKLLEFYNAEKQDKKSVGNMRPIKRMVKECGAGLTKKRITCHSGKLYP